MPVLAIILLAIMIGTLGFGDTLQAILGAVGFFLLLGLVVVGLIAATGAILFRRAKRRLVGRG